MEQYYIKAKCYSLSYEYSRTFSCSLERKVLIKSQSIIKGTAEVLAEMIWMPRCGRAKLLCEMRDLLGENFLYLCYYVGLYFSHLLLSCNRTRISVSMVFESACYDEYQSREELIECVWFFFAQYAQLYLSIVLKLFFFLTSGKNKYHKISFYGKNWWFVGKWMTALVVNYLYTMADTA